MKFLSILFPILLIINNIAIGQTESTENSMGNLFLNSSFTAKMLDPTKDLRKTEIFLQERKNGVLPESSLHIGASLIAIADFQKSNTDSKFAYLMRHPTANNEVGETVTEAALHSFQLSLAGSVNSWLSAYMELLYNPEQSFGQGTTTSLGRNGLQLRKGFVVLGDLNKFPMYLALGKMDGNFGQTGSVSPFTNSTMWHAYGTLAYGAMLGYSASGLSISAMLIQGGAQFRAAHTPVEGTSVPSKLNNFSFDANYSFEITNSVVLKLGGSYQKGSAYCQGYPVQHFEPCEKSNPAYTFYGKLDLDQFTLMGSFASTVDPWPGSHNPNEPLNEFEAVKVSSLSLGGGYTFISNSDFQFGVSGEFSNFVAGADDSPWERQNQIILGLCAQVKGSSKLFLEIFHTQGYAPLNFISGGNLEDPGTTHSDREARSTGVVIGGMITI